MSTGLECDFIEVEPAVWYYLLQDWSCPVGAWDWREFATAYGPFATYEEAHEHLRTNHANPGGHTVREFREGYKPNATLQKAIDEVAKRKEAERAANAARWRY